MLLLAASCGFYMAFIPVYILILLTTILIDYFAAMIIESSEGEKRKRWLIISIISTCLVLFVFKYFNFFNANFAALAGWLHLNYPIEIINIVLPIGLSFHTFQSLSYVIEVYRGRQKAERHFGIYSLYVMFYPQLVAGPIERPQNLLPQFREVHVFEYQRVTDGLKLMAWGLFKKVVIADRLAVFVNQVYGDPRGFDGLAFVFAAIFFAFQIYCDFSGYSDMAVGAARVMGFRLIQNFNYPFSAKSTAEFWQRWHISLTSWFKDYVYAPLNAGKTTGSRPQLNLFLTFLLSGLWHGANWTFVLWGGLNGFYILSSHWAKSIRKRVSHLVRGPGLPRTPDALQVVLTFALFSFAGIFFRSKDLGDAWYIITHLSQGLGDPSAYARALSGMVDFKGFGTNKFLFCLLAILFLEGVQWSQRRIDLRRAVAEKPTWLRWGLYYLAVFSILRFGVFEKNEFIYFQF